MSSIGGQAIPALATNGHYVGDNTANRAIPHGLGRKPKMVIIAGVPAASFTSGFLFNRTDIGDTVSDPMVTPGGGAAVTSAAAQVCTVMDDTNFYVNGGNGFNVNLKDFYWMAV